MATDERKNDNNRIMDKLRTFYDQIVDSIDPCPRIAKKLFADKVITIDQLHDITSPDSAEKRAEKLFYILYKTQHPLAFISFRDALRLNPEYNWILELIDEKPTVTTAVGELANMKLENDSNAGSTKIPTVPPGSFTAKDKVSQNVPKVTNNDRAEPVPTDPAIENSEQKNGIKAKSPSNSSIPAKELSDSDINRGNHPLLPRFRVKHVPPFNPQAVAIWNDTLYIPATQSPGIRVYNAEPFAFQRTITVNGIKKPFDIVASENVLYVSEYEDKLIHRIQLPGDNVSNWTVDGIVLKLSIAKYGNVIVASWRPARIFEYTSFGNLVREIVVNRFDAYLVGLQYAIQMEGDKFLVCHTKITHNRLCLIDNTGRVIRCYGGNMGSGIGQLNMPYHMAINRNGFILVADCNNNRIVQLNPSLEYISETVGIQRPWRILLDEERRRLYVMELNAESLTVFDV